MLDRDKAMLFAHEWVAAWNSHDIERILAHWADECVFSSPLVAKITSNATGFVQGKSALRAYWERGLALSPDLHFELKDVFVGQSSLVIGYRNHRGQSCAEWLELGPDGRAVRGAAHYA